MADVFSPAKRSEIMSKIHQPTKLEGAVHGWLCGTKIKHRMYPKVEGRPDIVIYPWGGGEPVYVWINGCMWHACPLHYRRPKTNSEFWRRHIEGAERRRRRRIAQLPYRRKLVVWEHDVRSGKFKEILLEAAGRGVSGLSLGGSEG
jgi:DNA mismatch endonuclease (patch repair protein)